MAIYQLKTFADLVAAVREELKIQSTDSVTIQRIKRDINMVYLNEVVPRETWKWLRRRADLVQNAVIETGTAAVTQGSTSVTLSSAPTISVKDYYFSAAANSTQYRIAQHTAGSTTVTLEAAYVDSTSASTSYKIWTDAIPLPSDCRETFKVVRDDSVVPLESNGIREFREHQIILPKQEGKPVRYSTSDYVDPLAFEDVSGAPSITHRASSGLIKTLTFASDPSDYYSVGNRIQVSGAGNRVYNGTFIVSSVTSSTITYTARVALSETTTADASIDLKVANAESVEERYRNLLIHPAITDDPILLHVDYVRQAPALEADSDEPLMPIEDRIILLYGALVKGWSRERNPEEAGRNAALFQQKLVEMAGNNDDSYDPVKMKVSRTYLATKRKKLRFPWDFRRFN